MGYYCTDDELRKCECPYDLEDPAQAAEWDAELRMHWYREGLKLSYPRLYMLYLYVRLLVGRLL